MAAKKPTPKLNKKEKMALYESYVGKKWKMADEFGYVYAVGCIFPKRPVENAWVKGLSPKSKDPCFGLARETSPYYYVWGCADFVANALPVDPGEIETCYNCDVQTGYATLSPDGYVQCPVHYLGGVTETCEKCGCLDSYESAAWLGDHVVCRSCYHDMSDAEKAAMDAE